MGTEQIISRLDVFNSEEDMKLFGGSGPHKRLSLLHNARCGAIATLPLEPVIRFNYSHYVLYLYFCPLFTIVCS